MDAQQILDSIKRMEVDGAAARLASALEPFGLDVLLLPGTDDVGVADLRLRVARGQTAGGRVGFAGWHLSGMMAVVIYETERVWLRKPINMSFVSGTTAPSQ